MTKRRTGAAKASTIDSSARTFKERYAAGKALRATCPREAHATWKHPPSRPTPVETVLAPGKGRVPELLPLRHGRMVRSPFTFYRGSALAMAHDLASTPTTGVRVQACGDAFARDAAMACVRSYRESMAEFSRMKTLELWYRALGAEERIGALPADLRKRAVKRIRKEQGKSRGGGGAVPEAGRAQRGQAPDQGSAPDDLPRPGPYAA